MPEASQTLGFDPQICDLQGRIAWVTGASRGLGRSIAFGLARAQAEVVLSARNELALADVADSIRAEGGKARVLPVSVDQPLSVIQAVERIEEEFGVPEVLVNAAGVSPSFAPAIDVELADWRQILDVNLSGVFYCSREAGKRMVEARRGSVINISSVHAVAASPRLGPYAAAKAAVEALTRTLALEWAPAGVRANAVAPGYFETDMTAGLQASERHRQRILSRIPIGRFGTPEELVPVVLLLASDASAYITGSTLTCDGGWTAH